MPKKKSSHTKNKKRNTVITKKAEYVIIKKQNVFKKMGNVLMGSLSKKFGGVKLPKFNLPTINIPTVKFPSKFENYKTQILGVASLATISLLILASASAYNQLAVSEDVELNLSEKSYIVYVDGEEVGVVKDSSYVNNAIDTIENSYTNTYNSSGSLVSDIEIVETTGDVETISSVELLNKLKSSAVVKSTAFGVFINDELVGALSTESEANEILNKIVDHFTQSYEDEEIVEIALSETFEVKEIATEHSDLVTSEEIMEHIIIGTDEKITYTVQSGDSYWKIASNHDMTVDELFSANPDASSDRLMPGDELSLVVPVPLVAVNVTLNLTEETETPYDTITEQVSYMYTDQSTVKTAGVYGIDAVEYHVVEQNGIEISREELSRTTVSLPSSEVVLVGTQTPPPTVGTGYFIEPLPNSYVSSRFGSRWGGYHYGTDFAKGHGSSIYAADGGTVTYSGWNGSYGYFIEIDHGGGWTTRYAHASQLYVSAGEQVYQGQIIAAVGSTGVSTGPHLHFEVRKYDQAYNPQNYIGYTYK